MGIKYELPGSLSSSAKKVSVIDSLSNRTIYSCDTYFLQTL